MSKEKPVDPSENNVETQLISKPKVYALFYASWCPHSRRFLPIFEEYAKTHPDQCLKVMIDFKEDLCEKYGIEYYPTVLCLREGKIDKRLDAKPGLGLTKTQLQDLVAKT